MQPESCRVPQNVFFGRFSFDNGACRYHCSVLSGTFSANSRVGLSQKLLMLSKFAPPKSASRKFTPRKSASRKFAPRKFAPRKFTPRKFALHKFAPRKFAF